MGENDWPQVSGNLRMAWKSLTWMMRTWAVSSTGFFNVSRGGSRGGGRGGGVSSAGGSDGGGGF